MSATVAQRFFGGELIKGEIGIEVEIEGEALPGNIPKSTDATKYWTVTPDGSLRGEAAEFVLAHPVARDEVDVALKQLYNKLDKCKLIDSGRAGVHVHVNVRELTIVQMYTFAMLYLVFEKALVDFCGKSRVGNLFCLRASDAEYLTFAVTNAIINSRVNTLSTNDLRYASINFTALSKYGSLEFRAMRSPVKAEVISQWVNLLLCLKDASINFKEPDELLSNVSGQGGYDFARSIFQEKLDIFGVVDWNQEVMKGLRLIQPAIKALSESSKRPEPIPNPYIPHPSDVINPAARTQSAARRLRANEEADLLQIFADISIQAGSQRIWRR